MESTKKSAPFHVKKQERDLLLIGKTGNGKSALGNSILNSKEFISKPSASSVTKEITSASTELCDRIINVYDSPGLGDTDWEVNGGNQFMLNAMSDAISANPNGYHAFILVLKFGARFNNEDNKIIQYLKKIFGENVISKYCIIVMTYGDQFSIQVEGSFHEWLKEQETHLAEVLKECSYRAVLFDNRTENEDIRERQRLQLLNLVEELVIVNCRYTNGEFELAKSTRTVLLLESNIPNIFNELDDIYEKFKFCQENGEDKDNKYILEELLRKTNRIYETLTKEDQDKTIFTEMIKNLESVKESIVNAIKIRNKLTEMRFRFEAEKIHFAAEQKTLVALEKANTTKFKIDYQKEVEDEMRQLQTMLELERERASNFETEMTLIKKKYNKSVFQKVKSKIIKSLKKNCSD